MSQTMICKERKQLADAYRESVDKFRDAVSTMRQLQGGAFNRAFAESEALRIVADEARRALEIHRLQHRC
jgi:hypothetical protein